MQDKDWVIHSIQELGFKKANIEIGKNNQDPDSKKILLYANTYSIYFQGNKDLLIHLSKGVICFCFFFFSEDYSDFRVKSGWVGILEQRQNGLLEPTQKFPDNLKINMNENNLNKYHAVEILDRNKDVIPKIQNK